MTDIGGQLGCAVGDASQDLLETLFNMLVGGATWAVEWTGTAWLSFPEPTIGTADGTPSENIAQLWSLGSFYILGIAIIGFLIGAARLMFAPSAQTASGLVRGLLAIIAVQTVGIGATVLLLDAGNQFSVWVVEQAGGKEFDTALADFSGLGGVTKQLLASGSLQGLGSVAAFAVVGFLLLLLAAVAQVALLIVRSALLIVLLAFIPFLAASAFTDGGYKALSRAVGWIFALILYKPVAGIIYAVGVLTLKNAADEPTAEEQMLNLLIAVVIVAAAALALPALVKFVAPQAAAGASMAFSGGAVAAGAIGTGAAVVAMGATAGAGGAAAAGGAASAGSGAVKPSTAGDGGTGSSQPSTPADSASDAAPTDGGTTGSVPTSSDGGTDAAPTPAGNTDTGEGGSDAPSESGASQSSPPTGGEDKPAPSSGKPSSGPSSQSSDTSKGPEAPSETPDGSSRAKDSASPGNSSSSDAKPMPPNADGAEAPSAPAPSGSSSSPSVAGTVSSMAKGAHQGAEDVDFNEGQEGS